MKAITQRSANTSEDQAERLKAIAAKCPVHRTLQGEVEFDERIERLQP